MPTNIYPTPAEVDAMKARCEKATRGPWHSRQEFANRHEIFIEKEGFVPVALAHVSTTVLEVGVSDENTTANADFIAHARTDLPRLLALYEQQQERIARLEAVVREAILLVEESRNCSSKLESQVCRNPDLPSAYTTIYRAVLTRCDSIDSLVRALVEGGK